MPYKVNPVTGKLKKGFGGMDTERVREISRMGAKRTHELGKAYQWNSKTAKAAGKIGGRNRYKSSLKGGE